MENSIGSVVIEILSYRQKPYYFIYSEVPYVYAKAKECRISYLNVHL